jgi:acetyltransferase-like isoleucine patch superfamily enzyme
MNDTSLANNEPLTRETLVETLSDRKKSPLQKYRQFYVGSDSFWELFKYELLTCLLSPLPGLPGLALRGFFYRALLGEMGRATAIGANVTLRCPARIRMGANAFIEDGVVMDAKGAGAVIRLGNLVLIGRSSVISCSSAPIAIGDDVSIGPQCFIRAGIAPVAIGSQVSIGSHSAIVAGNPSHKRLDLPMKQQIGSSKGVEIGDDVWIGVGARIIDGVRVGNGSVVGAGAVVIEDVSDFAIVAGVPARPIGSRKA